MASIIRGNYNIQKETLFKNLLESKYSNKVIIKEGGDLSELEPFNKQDYINIINYETHGFSRRKKHWEKTDEIDQSHKVIEPQIYLLKSIIKNERESNNNNFSSVVGNNQNYEPKYDGSLNTRNNSNHEYNLLSQQLAKQNSFSSHKTVTNVKEFKKYIIKPTPFKIWIEEYKNNEKKKYVSYIDVREKVTFPFLRIDDIGPVLESTPSYRKQIRPSLLYFKPILKIPFSDDGKKIFMAKRNFPGFPVIKWKLKKEQKDKQKTEKTTKNSTDDYKTTKNSTDDYKTTKEEPKNIISSTQATTVKSVMDKLNEINLDDKYPEHTVKTMTTTVKGYSEKFCETETAETIYISAVSTKPCKNYSGIIHCPNCRKKIRYNMEIIKNIPETNTNNPTYPAHKYTC